MNRALRLAQEVETGFIVCTQTGEFFALEDAYLFDTTDLNDEQCEQFLGNKPEKRAYAALKEGVCLADALNPESVEGSDDN